MKKVYQWRELTDDGLLKTPRECSYDRYCSISPNGYHGEYDSEFEAIEGYKKYVKQCGEYRYESRLILVTFYVPEWEVDGQ